MATQTEILRACNHERKPCEVNMGHGEILNVCAECWNQSVDARRRNRKAQLAEHWQEYRAKQIEAMKAAGAAVGDRVQYFAPSMSRTVFRAKMIRCARFATM